MSLTHTTRILLTTMLACTLGAVSAWAQTTEMSAGEVRKVDKTSSKITIKHGDIKNLDMPAMTMVFQVRDPALLEKAKAGDKVRFVAEQKDGAIIVTAIEAAP